MSTTPDPVADIEARLRAALAARAELVGPQDLAPLSPVVQLRPRWQSPWVLLATAAVVLLVLGVVVQGVGGRQRSDDVAPRPDEPRLELPADVGRDWKADDLSSPARLDLDGDGTDETVEFLAEETATYDGRTRLQTTLSSTGVEAYGMAELGTTIGVSALGAVDADEDGDQELVLLREDLTTAHGGNRPVLFDLREGLLVEAVVEEPDLLVRREVPAAGGGTEHYDMVHLQEWWLERGQLWSGRSRNTYATAAMTLLRPEVAVLDAWRWTLGEDGVLRRGPTDCRSDTYGETGECRAGQVDSPPVLGPVADQTIGEGQQAELGDGFSFTGGIRNGVLTARVGGDVLELGLDVPEPLLHTQQPTGIFYDGASFVVTSASDPARVEVVVQRGERLRVLEPVGEVPLSNGDDVRTWLTGDGALLTAVAGDEHWQVWQWTMVSGSEVAALPMGVTCFDDAGDPSAARPC
ncbi:hypothetical protein [Nocardioides sp. SYSU D00065]|uniref:hypothetical protein n=1 Tax=Nocardioides sp. SYSU D00065 TaxID=2817378 RepID=UPI001B32F961|nr:hypothetical protein [Nocardioides sp. SYSU D00065]